MEALSPNVFVEPSPMEIDLMRGCVSHRRGPCQANGLLEQPTNGEDTLLKRKKKREDMEVRRLDVNLICAQDLKDASLMGTLRAYAVAWLDPSSPQQSQLSSEATHTNPVWIDQSFSFFPIPESSFHHRAAHLTIQIFHRSALILPRTRKALVGTAKVPLMDIVDKGTDTLTLMWCDVVRPSSGRVQGRVKLGLQVGPKELRNDVVNERVMAYPAFDDYIGTRPRFQCYPNSHRRLPRGLPAVPYYAPPLSSTFGASDFAYHGPSIPAASDDDGDVSWDNDGVSS